MGVVVADALPVEPLEALRELARGEVEIDQLRRITITAARDAGATWEQIGQALGMTRQSAWEYFTRGARDELAANIARNSSGLDETAAMALAVAETKQARRTRRQI